MTVMHPKAVGAEWTQPPCTASSQWEREFGRMYGLQHQPAQSHPVHVPKRQTVKSNQPRGGEGEEYDEKQRKSSSREFAPPVPGVRNEGIPAGSFFDASLPPRNGASAGNGDDFNSPKGGQESEAGRRGLDHLGSNRKEKRYREWRRGGLVKIQSK